MTETVIDHIVVAAAPDALHYVVHVAPAARPAEPVCPTTATVHPLDRLVERPLSVCGGCLSALVDRQDQITIAGIERGAKLVRDYLADMARMSREAAAERQASRFDRRRVRAVVEFDVSLDDVDASSAHPRAWGVAHEVDRRVRDAVAAIDGVTGARVSDFRMTDPPREG